MATHPQKTKAVEQVMRGAEPSEVAARVNATESEVHEWVAVYRKGGVEHLRAAYPPKSAQQRFPPPAPDLTTVAQALAYAAPAADKKPYGQYLSAGLAVVLANGLRARGFVGVLPDERGGFESPARSARGLKKLDVNYSTPQMGLGLGLSVKTISKPDGDSNRYTKNYSRNDNELRAEAVDYHRRQPWAVLAAFLFLPLAACDDGAHDEQGVSSFGAAVRHFRYRTPRPEFDDEQDLFEGFFVAVYDPDGATQFWPVHDIDRRPPRARRPAPGEAMTLDEALDNCVALFDRRNTPAFEWGA